MALRSLSVALLAVAVLLAGCGATESPGAGTTPPANTATPTATPPPGESVFPPGVAEDGIDDPLELTNAHASVLADTPFAVTVNTTERFENGTLGTRKRTQGTFAQEKDTYVVEHVVAGSEPSMMGSSAGQLSVWADGERIYQRIVVGGSTSYQLLHDANGDLRDPRDHLFADQIEEDRLYVLFSAMDFSVERVQDEPGTYRLTSETLSDPDAIASSLGLDGIDRASLTAVVGERGVVHEYRVEYVGSVGDRTVRGVHEVEYDEVGSASVERPSWADEAVNATSG